MRTRSGGAVSPGTMIGVIVVLVVVIGIIALVASVAVPAIRKISNSYALSTKPIDVSMHDETKLQRRYYNNPSLGCRIRLHKEALPPMPMAVPETEGAVASASPTIRTLLARSDRGKHSFDTWVSLNRRGLPLSLKGVVIEDEGTAEIHGLRAYVLTLRWLQDGREVRGRLFLLNGSGNKAYMFTGSTDASQWSAWESTVDSMASTLEVGTFAEETVPPPLAERPTMPGAGGPDATNPGSLLEELYYENTQADLKIRLPLGLGRDSSRIEDRIINSIMLPGMVAGFKVGSEDGMAVLGGLYDRGGADADAYIKSVLSQMKTELHVIGPTQERVTSASGRRVYIFTGSYIDGGVPRATRIWLVQGAGTKVYLFQGTAATGKWAQAMPAFDASAETLRSLQGENLLAGIPPMASAGRTPDPSPTRIESRVGPEVMRAPPRVVEAMKDGQWVRAIQREETADKVRIQWLDGGLRSEVWLSKDQVRPYSRVASPTFAPVPSPPAVTPPPPTPPERTPPVRPKPFGGPESIEAAIVMLDATSPLDQKMALEYLAEQKPDKEHQAGVVKQVSAVFKSNNMFTRSESARVLAIWGDDALEKTFIDRLLTGTRNDRRVIFEYLAARKTPNATKALAKRLRVSEDTASASECLIKMGSFAEPAVREIAGDIDKKNKKAAIEVLAKIGTRDSLAVLRKCAGDSDPVVSASAKLAMDAINAREK